MVNFHINLNTYLFSTIESHLACAVSRARSQASLLGGLICFARATDFLFKKKLFGNV